MKRAIWLVFIVGLGCGKSGGDASAPAATPESEQPAQAPSNATPEQHLKLAASKAKAFVGYQEKHLAVLAENSKAVAAISAKVDKASGLTAAAQFTKDALSQGNHLNEQLAAMRKEFSLTEEELNALGEIQGAVLMRNSPLAKHMASQIPVLEQQMPKIPPQMRADSETALKEMKEQVAAIDSMKEVRANYGDAIVDAMLAEGPKLQSQFDSIGKPQ